MTTPKPSALPLASLMLAFCLACFSHVAPAADTDTASPAPFVVTVTGLGRPMILIPGLACGGMVWDGTVAHFKDAYECHVVTIAGFAGQPAVADASVNKVLEGLQKYIRDKKLQRPVIIGHSMGGFLGYWLGAEMPGEVGPIIAVDGVPYYPALIEADATSESQRPKAEMFRTMIQGQTPQQFAVMNKMTLATMITNPKDLERIAASSNLSDPKAVGQAFYELITVDLREKLKSIQSPVLLLGASNAPAAAANKEQVEMLYRAQLTAVPRHKVVFAPKARHFIQLDEPEFFFREVETFLKESDAAKQE